MTFPIYGKHIPNQFLSPFLAHISDINWWLIFAEAFPDGFQIPTASAGLRSRRWELGKTYGDLLILIIW